MSKVIIEIPDGKLCCLVKKSTDILLPEYSEVVAWMHVPMPYEGE